MKELVEKRGKYGLYWTNESMVSYATWSGLGREHAPDLDQVFLKKMPELMKRTGWSWTWWALAPLPEEVPDNKPEWGELSP